MHGTQQCSTTGDPRGYKPYEAVNLGLRALLVDRLGFSAKDQDSLAAGSAVVGIAFPDVMGGELRLPMLVIAVPMSDDAEALAGRLSTARFTLTWQTTKAEILSCQLYVPGQVLHRQEEDSVFRLFACMSTSMYRGSNRLDTKFVPLENFQALRHVHVLFGEDGEYGQFAPISPQVNSGNALRSLRFAIPTTAIPAP